ncbi:hypothetical protein [Falsihalocynthiibacter arcticus]|uniref:hypothetical protein n=1 Tax=Falsihalocynthiibacter arcticus TaxID=1579316 RepID=UPI0030032801
MSSLGWIRISRKLFKDHPFFDDEPMSEREAWIWMLTRAAWEDTRHKVGQEMVPVPRGSFMVTLREMQSAFMWRSDTKVRNFLKRLEGETMIERATVGSRNAPKTHVIICNYEKFQSSERTENAPETHRERTKNAVKKEPNNKQQKEEANASMRDVPSVNEIAEAVLVYNDAADQSSWPSVQNLTPARRTLLQARLSDVGGIEGWRDAITKATNSDFLCGRTANPWSGFSFDWLTKQANFTKLMEGNYDERTNAKASQPQNARGISRNDPALERIARLAGINETQSHGGE